MSSSGVLDVYYRHGANCIVTSVKGPKEVNLRFVIERKQHTVTYVEKKKNFDGRNLAMLLKGTEAVKASIWNVPFGPPGANKRCWYVTDIWTPKVVGMEKKRIPEPTISIVCKILYNLGKEFFVCELGKHFARDVIILPRALITSAPSFGKGEAEIGDHLLITALIIWETQGDEQKARLIPLWAHWDRNNRTQQSVIHLNIVENGPEKSTLIIPDQIPCMWGIVQAIFKKSMKVYVPALSISLSVQFSAIFQFDNSSCVAEGEWLQLWLTPKAPQANLQLSEINSWACSNCCWFGPSSKKVYEAYLHYRLKSSYLKQETSENAAPTNKNVPKAISKVQAGSNAGDSQAEIVVVGTAKVKQIKEKSGTLLINSTEYVFHLGIMNVYGIKMSKIKNVKIKDLVDIGTELRFRLNAKSDGLKSVWIGPEVVTFKHLNFMPQLTQWIKNRNLDTGIMKELMKEITDNFEAVNKNKEKELPKVAPTKKEKKNSKEEKLSSCSNHTSQASLVSEGDSSVENEFTSALKNLNLSTENIDSSYCPDDIASSLSYTKEDVDKLELWWTEDSDESDDELRPILRSDAQPLEPEDVGEDPQEISVGSFKESGKSSLLPEVERSESSKIQSLEENISEKDPKSTLLVKSEVSTSLSQFGAEGFTKALENSKVGKTDIEKDPIQKKTIVDEAKATTKTKPKSASGAPSLLIMMELTKFLLEKGKAKSIPEAGEISAEFVALLEGALSKTSSDLDSFETCEDVGTQTEITGPVLSVNVRVEDEENLSRLCGNGVVNNTLSLVD